MYKELIDKYDTHDSSPIPNSKLVIIDKIMEEIK